MTVRHEAFKKKVASEAAAKQYNKEQKLKMQKIAKSTAKRMITRRSEQASNKARREEGSAKRERRARRTRRNERQAGLTTAEIRTKREKKGIGKFAKTTKSKEKTKRTPAEKKANRMKKGIGRYAK